MNPYILSCCSTFDLDKEYFEKRNISYACFHFSINGKNYIDDLGQSISFKDFYKKISPKGTEVKTSQVNVGEFIEYFTPFLEKGLDILHVSLSSGLSGAYNSALIAKKELEEKFPKRKIYVLDSLAASSGGGLLMDKLADLRDNGKTIDELFNWAEENKLYLHHWFFSTDLSFYIRGGRISKAAGLVGTLLKICPVLNVSSLGKLTPILKVRTKEKAITEAFKKMVENANGGEDYAERCFISHSDCYEDAKALADLIENHFKHLKGKVKINYIGPTIGSHTGPGTVALFFWGKKRTN
ncbi:MAG: DegV family protein [Clostridia bacterium]|nr:DegV family protein [Clostridia bacterium]